MVFVAVGVFLFVCLGLLWLGFFFVVGWFFRVVGFEEKEIH